MATATTNANMDGNNESVSILAKVMAAGRAMPQDLTLEAKLSLTVGDLKTQIKTAMESHPDINNQRIIFQGRQLADDAVLKQVFQSNLDHGHPIAIHVVIRPSPQTPTTTTVPSRSFFGGSTTPATPASSSPAPPPTRTQPSRPASNPPAAAPPQPPGYSPFYSRTSATTSRTSTSNGTVVRQTEITIRSERIVQTPDGNWQQQRGEARQTLPSDGTQPVQVSSTVETTPLQAGENRETAAPNTPSVTSPSGSSTARRVQRTIQTQTSTFRITSRTPGGSISSTPNNRAFTSGLSLGGNTGTDIPTTTPGNLAQSAGGQPTYWLLQGPAGPASILTPPGGNAAPYAQRFANIPLNSLGSGIQIPPVGLPMNNYSMLSPEHQEAMLRTQIDNIRRSNVERLALLEAERQVLLRQIRATEAPSQIAGGARVPPGGLLHVQFNPLHFLLDLVVLAIGGGNPNAPAPTQETILNALRDFWSVIWFAIKTLGMAYMLSTNGRDVRRDTVVWGGAAIILLLRIRLFETWLNALGQRLNAMIPDPNRPAPPPVQFQPDANAEPGLPNPQEVAQRWIQQHNERQQAGVGGVVNAVQNGVSLFMASLIPGLGERVGNARAAEMERLRQALATAHAAAAGEVPPNAEEATAEGQPGEQQQAPGEAPGPQAEGVVDAARNHFGEERAGELFGQPQGPQEEVQPMFGL